MIKMERENKKHINKKLIAITLSCIIVVVVAIILIICLTKTKSNEAELNNNLKKLGSQFYEEFYYPTQERVQKDVKTFVAKSKSNGIKVNLENIAKVSKIDKKLVEKMVNNKTKKDCDKTQTYVVIKPVSPYGKKDYKIETYLSCGFKDEKNKNTSLE